MVSFSRRGAILLAFLFLCFSAPVRAQGEEILPLDQIKPGMRGQAHTIFSGRAIESFDLEVLGVLHNLVGPGQDVILVRLLGDKVDYTGVVAGMSGSPVTIDGKLVGALAYRFGIFTKEPIAGITPIESMFRAAREGRAAENTSTQVSLPKRYPLPEEALATTDVQVADPYLVPIETPLTFVGFHPQVINRFSQELGQYGLMAVQGGGTAEDDRTSSLEPGGAVAAALVTGDMSIAGTCTISHRVDDQLYACGHVMLGLGEVQLPMATSEIVTTVPSDYSSFKIANLGKVVGSFEQDRTSAIVGRLGAMAPMIPVDLTLVHQGSSHTYHYEIFQHPKVSPLLFLITVFNGLFAPIEAGAEMTYRVSGRVKLKGHNDVVLDDMFSPTDSFFPDAFFVANNVGNTFRQIFTNPFESPVIEGIDLRAELLPDRQTASIENAWSDKSEVRPGETVRVKVVLQPYRGPRMVREVPVTIPANAAEGDLRVLVSDADSLNRITRTLLFGWNFPTTFAFGPRVTSLEQLVGLLNRERRNDSLYVAVFQRSPTLLVEDKVLPSVPLSQMNVLNHRSNTLRPGGTLLFYESILNETSEKLGQVITGSHWLRLTVR